MQFTNEQQRFIDEHYQLLPEDADGVPIRVGDTLDGCGETTVVRRLTLDDDGWFMTCENGLWFGFDAFTHHKPTVEDVLRGFAEGLGVPVADSYVAATAARLRLAGEGE